MIDINHPNSKFIFEASGYTARIKGLCQIYIKQDFENRKETFEKMELECTNLKIFSEKHFKENIIDINEITDEIISEIRILGGINDLTEDGNCTVCNSKLNTFDSLVKEVGMVDWSCFHIKNE
ncbi:hypothetical protein [Winogradskyella sp.]|jgi:hypothetical protein|uniref:hypothetical protein n=1 Tax=Winogradskyella sp. TaxID=1883156 RepID=UPI0025E36771|nr:hypothetical protein [Winogradskyella sp.]MCT4628354.1 hypothetical protein [Winogradskyella sp.]